MKGPPAETGVNAHQQHDIEFVHHPVHVIQRCRRIEDEAGLAAAVADQAERAIDMLRTFRVEGDDVGTGLGESPGRCGRPV